MSNTITASTVLPPLVQAFYDRKFLLRAKGDLVAYQFAQKRPLPEGEGKTVYFTRYDSLAKQTSALDETDDGGIPIGSAKTLSAQEISATVALWGDWVAISRLSLLTSIDRGVSEKVSILGQQMGESIDYEILLKLTAGMQRRLVNSDGSYQVEGVGTSGTTTTMVDTVNLTQADDYWNGGYICITAGTNYGSVRKITDFVNSTATLTFAAMAKACDTTSYYRVTVATAITAADVLDTPTLRLALRDLKRAKALKMKNGYFVCLIDPDVEYDFMGDTTWQNAAVYKDRVDSLYTGEIGKWLGIRFVGASQQIRETVAGTVSATGAAHISTIFGQEAYGVVELEGAGQKIYVKTPDQLGQAIPRYGTCWWEAGFAAKALNGNFGVSIISGASA